MTRLGADRCARFLEPDDARQFLGDGYPVRNFGHRRHAAHHVLGGLGGGLVTSFLRKFSALRRERAGRVSTPASSSRSAHSSPMPVTRARSARFRCT
jgi:hypothetical protein